MIVRAIATAALIGSTVGPAVVLLVRDLRSGQYPTYEQEDRA